MHRKAGSGIDLYSQLHPSFAVISSLLRTTGTLRTPYFQCINTSIEVH